MSFKLSDTIRRLARVDVGVEREGLRVTQQGVLAHTPHSTVFGNKLTNSYISVDYAEQQFEVITPARPSVSETHQFARALYDIVALQAHSNGEVVWSYSMPCALPGDDEIEIARYDESPQGVAAYAYRERLAQRYGKAQQMMSGVHYNVSFPQALIEQLWQESGESASTSLRDFRDAAYLKVVRNYLHFGWMLVYLTGATPAFHCSVTRGNCTGMSGLEVEHFEADTGILTQGISCRNGRFGYRNITAIYPDYTSVVSFISSMRDYIDSGVLSEPKELYSSIRIKSSRPDDMLECLEENGIVYLELRSLDVNPFDPAGIAPVDMEFINLFVLWLLLRDDDQLNESWQVDAEHNMMRVAESGLTPGLELANKGEMVNMREWALSILTEMDVMQSGLIGKPCECLLEMRNRFEHPALTYAARISAQVRENGYVETIMSLSRAHQEDSYDHRWLLSGFEHLEMSTQILIKEAMTRGISVEVIDARDNLIKLTHNGRTEYVKQATKTSADTYITPLLMENKSVSKRIMAEAGITVPRGDEFISADAQHILSNYVMIPAVIKPKSTNFGLGVTMFPHGASLEALCDAADEAYAYDEVVLVEEFVSGKEYRFITIGDKVAGILHRVPANVVGNGASTVSQLIELKNQHPYRGPGYRTPLKTIELDNQALEYLARQNLTPDSIVADGQTVYLRPNSNISTGGDSIDMTDVVDPYFKQIAVDAAKAFDAAFCGVDIIIGDCTDGASPYAVIEVNFNPAIHIHCFPAVGTERFLGADVLRQIGIIDTTD